MKRRHLLGAVGAGAVGLTGLGLLPSRSVSEEPSMAGEVKRFREITAAERRRRRFLNVALTTHEGKNVRFYDDLLKDKTVLMNFMYTNCVGEATCPLMTANLLGVQKLLGERIGRDIFIYSITLDPEHDTPAVLAKYARAFGAKPGWLFLTGGTEDVEALRKNLGFATADPALDKDRTQHLGVVKYGIERLERWAGCPALAKPRTISRNVLALERPLDWRRKTLT